MEMKVLLERYETIENFESDHDLITKASDFRDTIECLVAESPSIGDLQIAYGSRTKIWIKKQIDSISTIAGVRDKLLAPQIVMLIEVFISNPKVKASCLMNFFHRLISGKYGRFYGAIDVMQIGESWQEYLKEIKEIEISVEEELKAKAKAEREASEHRISFEEFRANQKAKGVDVPNLSELFGSILKKS